MVGEVLRSWRRGLTPLLALISLSGCSSVSLDVGYYWQSISGHLAVIRQAKPIDELLGQPDLDAKLRERLVSVQRIRRYASTRLDLPDNGSYTRFADLKRPYVVWNVFAAPEFSLRLKQWCFPIAGCISYRGYYDQQQAQTYADTLSAQGLDVYVAGVPAYSTLGWFDDPVLNTFIQYPEAELARLIFHELAHQVVYVKGDSTFNESFATSIEEAGVARWLEEQGSPAMKADYDRYNERRQAFVALLRRHRDELAALYEAATDDAQRREAKGRVFAAMQRDYAELKRGWGGYSGYDRWFGQRLSNAHLGSVATYTDLIPGFRRLLDQNHGELATFYARVREIAKLDKEERDKRLAP